MTQPPSTAPHGSVPSSWFTIVSVVLAELAVAATLAFTVAQVHVGYECGDATYREEHGARCAGGFPYPLF